MRLNLCLSLISLILTTPSFAKFDSNYQVKLNKYCEERKTCTDTKKNIADELVMVASCEEYYKENHCDEVKQRIGRASSDSMMTCKPEIFCENNDLNIIDCSVAGVASQLTFQNLITLTSGIVVASTASVSSGAAAFAASTMAGIPFSIYAAGKSAEECHKDLKFKSMAIRLHNLSLMEDEKQLNSEDKNLLHMQCHDLTTFLSRRLAILSEKRTEKQAWSLEKNASKQSEMTKALYASLNSSRCLKPAKIKQNICAIIAAAALGVVTGKVVSIPVKAGIRTFARPQIPELHELPSIGVYHGMRRRTSNGIELIGISEWKIQELPKGSVVYDMKGRKLIVGVDKFKENGEYGVRKSDFWSEDYGPISEEIPHGVRLDPDGYVSHVKLFAGETDINLLTLEQLKKLPPNTRLIDINGNEALIRNGRISIKTEDTLYVRELNNDLLMKDSKFSSFGIPRPLKEITTPPKGMVFAQQSRYSRGGIDLNLLTKKQLNELPVGTVLFSVDGQRVVVQKDALSTYIKGNFMLLNKSDVRSASEISNGSRSISSEGFGNDYTEFGFKRAQ